MQIDGNLFLITGSASGIGYALTQNLLNQGAMVIGFDVQPNHTLTHPNYEHYLVDITNEKLIISSLLQAMKNKEALSGIINLAGVTGANQSIHSCSPEDFKHIIDTHLFGTYNICYYGLKYLNTEKGGCIINTSSLFALKSTPNFIAYNAAKKAIISLTETLAIELAPTIRVNAIAPGFVNTPMTQSNPNYDKMLEVVKHTYPLQKPATSQQIVEAILFLIHNEFMTGETMAITGGAHL